MRGNREERRKKTKSIKAVVHAPHTLGSNVLLGADKRVGDNIRLGHDAWLLAAFLIL